MNVAIFASAFHPHFGGVEELCRQLAHEFRARGLGVIVVTNRWPRDLPAFEEFEGIPLYRVAMRVPDGSWRAKLNYYLTGPALRRETVSILRRHQIDVLHVQCVSANGLYALEAARRLSLPLVVTLQGELTMDAGRLFEHSVFAKRMLRDVLDGADVVTGCSRKTLEDGESFYGKPFGRRGMAIFNAARVEDFAPAAGAESESPPFQHPRPYILAIGRVVPQKGFDLLLRAFAAAKTGGVREGLGDGIGDHDLLIAGDGPQLPELQALARELGIESRVTFTGRAGRTGPRGAIALFRGCSFFVLPSRADEGLPVVCAEALAAGKAIVATRSGGTPEAILHEQCGLIVERNDLPALTAAITRLCREPETRRRFAAAAAARASLFSWRQVASEYQQAFILARTLHQQRLHPASAPPTDVSPVAEQPPSV